MSTDNILVAIKSRPLISRERSEKLKPKWKILDKAIFQTDEDGYRIGEPYSFDHIFTENETNSNVYDAVVEPLVKSFLEGFNSTIFAYGQTSSGKTYTMMGTENISGIVQKAISDVFEHVLQDTQRRYLISCSYFEIYNEKINDLLDKNGKDLKIREDFYGNTFVNAKEELVTEQEQVLDLMNVGNKIRKMGCTNMNERSSRSHTIFRLTIKSTENNVENGPVQISYLNLVDLAGSERVSQTGAAGVRLKEGVNINKSLLALGNVIRQLSESESEGFINYRDSNLTRLLQHSLGGNAKSLIIATITVAAADETKSTLEFAQRAKIIKNKPRINEILLGQDNVNQLVTTEYKNRLKKEQQRIAVLEQEREEREREISKLKQQVKLIELFKNGPEVKKHDSKIPRRHTMGHYSREPLQAIPQSRILAPNVIDDKPIETDVECNVVDEDSFLKRASRITDYEYMQTIIEESLDDCIPSLTPEPPDDLPIQEGGTPVVQLRRRLKLLEESYFALQEFTKLEAEFTDERGRVYELLTKKENLLKDVMDLHSMMKETNQEKEQLKMKLEQELFVLKDELDNQKRANDRLKFAMEQADSEKNTLKAEKEQVLIDKEVHLEQQKLKYEKQLQYFSTEIEQLNKENQRLDHNFKEEIKELRNENETYKLEIENIASYKEKITELEEKLATKEQEGMDILSVSTQTEAEITDKKVIKEAEYEKTIEEMTKLKEKIEQKEIMEAEYEKTIEEMKKLKEKIEQKEIMAAEYEKTIEEMTKMKEAIEQKEIMEAEYEKIIEEMTKLKDKIEHHQSVNDALEENLRNCKERNSDLEASNNNLKVEVAQKTEDFNVLTSKVHVLEAEIQNGKKEIEKRDKQLSELKKNIQNLEVTQSTKNKEILEKDKQISELKNKVSDLKMYISDKKEEIQIKDEQNSALQNAVQDLEKQNDSVKEEIRMQKVKINAKTQQILELTSKIESLEAEINDLKGSTQHKDELIRELRGRILKLDENYNKSKDEVSQCKEKMLLHEQEMKNLLECITSERLGKQKEINSLNKKVMLLTCGKKEIEKVLSILTSEKEKEAQKNCELERKLKSAYEDISNLSAKVHELEKKVEVFSSSTEHLNLEAKSTRHSTASSSSADLSPREIRRRKRQSIQDQRRGIDLSGPSEKSDRRSREVSSSTEKEYEEEIKKLKVTIEDLTNENNSLEFEVQGFIGELKDCKRDNQEMEKEIEELKLQLSNLRTGTSQGNPNCKECPQNQRLIKQLEGLQKQNSYKIVELQTNIFDLKNKYKEEKNYGEEKERRLNYHISKLEAKLGDKPIPETRNVKLQCDVINYEELLEKYNNTKKLARMRREEGNILRSRLGMKPDEPVN